MTAAAARAEARANTAAANAAAADAAADARAEVVTKVPGVSEATAARATRNGYYHFMVDVWITELQCDRVRRLQAHAQSRQVAPVHH
ncbi:hypothetical protein [Hyphomicrobium sp. D-2]|uniref:hypothetical protein n=1 Tax=Hyphomicrobium sp. D-2 TaxID=3041621 RepID=UPI0024563DF6|nr:hypothetical protein [Hyphomicrobium sp. D-2]MDH4983412.1 hypothetical protein [Hyphomicrobium sp. D-2]